MTTATVTKPLNNNVLIEVVREDDGVSRTDENEVLREGIVIDFSIDQYHITASAAIRFDKDYIASKTEEAASLSGKKLPRDFQSYLIGKKVRWEQYAEGGQTFEENGKTYAIIPWWRLISYEDTK
jgi:hypothetical protein